MTTPAIRLLIVEDNFITRIGIVTLLSRHPDIHVAGEAADGAAALEFLKTTPVDVVLSDLKMPHVDGVMLTRQIGRDHPNTRVVVLTHYDGDEDIVQALRAGALGYLTKETRGEEILLAVRSAHAGQRYFPPGIAGRLAERVLKPALSAREVQLLELIYQGRSNREIASASRLTERTVGIYVSRILQKLDAKNRTEAVHVAIARGIIKSGPG